MKSSLDGWLRTPVDILEFFASAIDDVMPEPTEPFPDDDHDILMTQRTEDATENTDDSDPQQKMPAEIKRY